MTATVKLAAAAVVCVVLIAVVQAQTVSSSTTTQAQPQNWTTTSTRMGLRQCCNIPVSFINPKTSCLNCPTESRVIGSSKSNHSAYPGCPKNCYIECLFKADHLMNDNGTAVNLTRVSERLASLASYGYFRGAADECLQILPPLKNSVCKSGASQILGCILKNVYQNCPDNLKTVSNKCSDLMGQF